MPAITSSAENRPAKGDRTVAVKRPYFASYYRWLVASQRLKLDLRARRVLDVGCNDGGFLRRSTAPLRVGVDLRPKIARAKDLDVVCADARKLPMQPASFDCILAFDVLEHIEHDRVVMREMLRLLAPDGTLWLSTPARNAEFWPPFVQPYANWAFGHVRNGYTHEELRALLPDDRWEMQLFYWDEPLLRTAFVPLHVIDRLAPPLADRLTRLCFAIDSHYPQGHRGHVFGRVRHRALEG